MTAHNDQKVLWTALKPAARRRRAEEACRQRDGEALWALTDAYLELHADPASGPSDHTRRAYRQSVQALVDRWDGDLLLHPSAGAAADFCQRLATSGLSAATVKVRLSGVRALYRALQWAGVLSEDPFAGVRPEADPERPPRTREPYDEAERAALLSAAGPVDRAMILLCAAGLPLSQSVSLTWPEVDLEAGRLLVQDGERSVPIGDELRQALSALPGARHGYVLGFGSEARARQRLREVCARAQVPYRGAQALRGAPQRNEAARSPSGFGGNLPALRDELGRAVALAQRTGGLSGVILIEVRHALGDGSVDGGTADRVFEAVAGRARRVIRQYDVLTPVTDRKLCLLLVNLPSQDVLAGVAHRFWSAVHARPVVVERGREVPISVTMGAAVGAQSAEAIMREAEEALRHASARAPEDPEALGIVRAWLEAFNRGDRAAFEHALAGDAVLTDMARGRSQRGRSRISAHAWARRGRAAGAHGEIANAFVSGGRVFLQIVWTGGLPGEQTPPGRYAAVPGYAVAEVHAGTIESVAYYVDPAVELAQLSVPPALPAAAPGGA